MSTVGVSPRFCVTWSAEFPRQNYNFEVKSKKFTFQNLKFRLQLYNLDVNRCDLWLSLAKGQLTSPLFVTVMVEDRTRDRVECRVLNSSRVQELPWICVFDEHRHYRRYGETSIKNRVIWKKLSFVIILEEDSTTVRNDNTERPIESSEGISKGPDFPSNLKNLSADFANLLKNETLPDVDLKCGARCSAIPAHRAVLAARSEVFAAMFRNGMAESLSRDVDVPDVEDDVMDPFLQYVYSGRIPSGVSDEVVPGLYAAADKYAVHALRETCRERMVKGLAEENCVDFLTVADAHGDVDLKRSAIDFICSHEAVLRRDAWRELLRKSPPLATEVYDSIFDAVDLADDVADLFLKYVDSGMIPPGLSDEVVPRLYDAGHKYAVRALTETCRERMVGCLTEDNLVDFLTLADAHGDVIFKELAIEFICNHKAVFNAEAWREFTKKPSLLAMEVYQSVLDRGT